MTIAGTDFTGESAPVAADTVTVLSGGTFALSWPSGDIDTSAPLGFFCEDTRLLSHWSMTVAGVHPTPLTHFIDAPWNCRFLGRVRTRHEHLLVARTRYVDQAMREDVEVTNLGHSRVSIPVEIDLATDFASLFAVKESRVERCPSQHQSTDDGTLVIGVSESGPESALGVRVRAPGARIEPGRLRYTVELGAGEHWRSVVHVLPVVNGTTHEPQFPEGRPIEETTSARRQREWEDRSSTISSSVEDLDRTLARSREDLGSLRIFDTPQGGDHTGLLPVIAAGSPWFMTLFGRDSLLTSYMSLALDPTLAQGVLEALARRQGTKVDLVTEEQPGRILHEVRFDEEDRVGPGGQQVYYGSIDSTPLFVALLGELIRWQGPSEAIEALLPAADLALEWVDRYGDRDGDGFVEYERSTPTGLRNQGWKDSWNGITFADGTVADPPIALCEVQGYVFAAFLARARLAGAFGHRDEALHWRDRAERLRLAFDDTFWLEDRGWYALGLDGDKRPIDSLASNQGQALWTGIVPKDRAAVVAKHLLSPELFSGWGVRTLATSMGAYDPFSYHNGSVWPHDTALIAGGLLRLGFIEEGQQVANALFDAADAVGGRLPELFAGLERSHYPKPVPYSTACSPQAWASAAPVHLVRNLLGLEPDVSDGLLRVGVRSSTRAGTLGLTSLRIADGEADVIAEPGTVEVTRLPPSLQWVKGD